jgi:hypothetical protein
VGGQQCSLLGRVSGAMTERGVSEAQVARSYASSMVGRCRLTLSNLY